MHWFTKDGLISEGILILVPLPTIGAQIVKFIYSEKATQFCEISTLLLSVYTLDKSKGAFSECINFLQLILIFCSGE